MFSLGSFAFVLLTLTLLLWWQGAAEDSEAKSEELSRAVEELHKLLKDAGEGVRLSKNDNYHPIVYYSLVDKDTIYTPYSSFSGSPAHLVSSGWYSLTFAQYTPPTTANKALEEKLQEMNGATDKSVAELKERIQGLEKELDNANELLSSSKLRGLFGWFF